ncbi:hypothetical protein IJX73_03725 [bacterium]|nr:hypothetical protein [bacterium]
MKNNKNILLCATIGICSILLSIYLLLIFILPFLITSPSLIKYLENNASEKIGQNVVIEKIEVKIKPNLETNSKLKVLLGSDSYFYLNIEGKVFDKKGKNVKILAKNLPIKETIKSLLYFQKSKDNKKKFLENFKDFNGLINADLTIDKTGINGNCNLVNFETKTVLFDVPLKLPKADFIFQNNELNSNAVGTLGTEKLAHNLKITNLLTKERVVDGEVISKLTPLLAKTYLPKNYNILNSADVRVNYNIENKKINVKYYLNLDKNSDIFFNNFYLGLRDKEKRFFVHTLKDGDNLYLKTYDYSIIENNQTKNIISGGGLFVNKNDKLTPQWITCKTNDYAPNSVTGSFGKYVIGGAFKGTLKYNFIKQIITGEFEVIDTIFNDFSVKSASVLADEKNVKISANGTYKKEKFNCELNAKNDFVSKINVYNLNLFLDKFDIKRNPPKPPKAKAKAKTKKKKKFDFYKMTSQVRKIEMDIDAWDIKVNKITMDNVVLDNVSIFGSLKDAIFNFSMPELSFAKGLLSAKGLYDFNNDSSEIDFIAKNIDSTIATNMLFDMNNQIQGIANATLKAKTSEKLKHLKAKGEFLIIDGFLPQIGNTEFLVKKFNKEKTFKISDLTNIDFTKKDSLNSDIKGSFILNDYNLDDINIYTSQKHLATYIIGNYEIKKQTANFQIFGKYNADIPKDLKILFVPIKWIVKLVFAKNEDIKSYQNQINKIPNIENSKKDFFKIVIKGNLNNEDIDVDIKGLK